MHSILFHLGPIPIYAYGFMLMLAFLAGTAVAMRLGKQRGIAPEQVMDVAVVILVAAIAGARLTYVALQWPYFRDNLTHVWRLWEGGLTFQGGLAAALLAGALYCHRHGLSFRRMGDVMAPGVALGYAIGRVGCFLNGCCYGGPTDLPWACRFHDPPITGPLTPPSHPTQIYASIINLGIFGLLLLIWHRQQESLAGSGKPISGSTGRPGLVLWSYLLFYAVYRFGIEFLRKGATAEVLAVGLTQAQWACIGSALGAGAVLIWLFRPGARTGRSALGLEQPAPKTEHPTPNTQPRIPNPDRPVGAAGKK